MNKRKLIGVILIIIGIVMLLIKPLSSLTGFAIAQISTVKNLWFYILGTVLLTSGLVMQARKENKGKLEYYIEKTIEDEKIDQTKIEPSILGKYTHPLTKHELELLSLPEDSPIQPLGTDMQVDPEYFRHEYKLKEFNGVSIYDLLMPVNYRLRDITSTEELGHKWDPKAIDTKRYRFVEGPRAIEARAYADCKGFSTLAIQLIRSLGVPARFLKLKNHIMIEINFNGKWIPFEPQRGITKKSNKVALEEIAKESE